MSDFVYRLRVLLPPWLFKSLLLCLALAMLIGVASLIPEGQSSALGARVHALKEAISWEIRAFRHSEDGFVALFTGASSYQPELETGGVFLGTTKAGNLLIDAYSGEQVEAVLADLVIDDASGVARFLKEFRFQHVLMEIYRTGEQELHIVRFTDGTPVNLALIEHNLAHAHPSPQTSLVDRMMATYWWQAFHGKVIPYESI